jgi:acetyl esterase/lipase
VFAVVHGSQPRYTVPEIRDDARRAVRFIRHRAKEYGIDPDRLGACGASSGGLLALHLGVPAPGDPGAEDRVERQECRVRAVACFFPPTDYLNYGGPGRELLRLEDIPADYRGAFDFRSYDPRRGVFVRPGDGGHGFFGRLAGPLAVRAAFRDISPVYHVTRGSAPTLLIHGDRDELVPLQQSETLAARLREVGVPVRLEVRKGAGHGWLTLPADIPLLADWFDRYVAP